MQLNLLAFIIPLILIFIGAEYLTSRRQQKKHFTFGESIANLNVGMAERLTDLLTTGTFYFLYSYLYQSYAIFSIPSSPVTWILLFILTDFIWYWYHRLAHQINIFWAAHIVHHQSEDFNYTTSTRITIFQACIRGSFWSILPIIGFSPEMIGAFLLVHGAYPFFTHTQTIGKLGWIEYVFVTPSHHRVHHASNAQYLDKNYGDILIIWDKLFGTFVKETVQPVYGITTPLRSHSFFWQHFHHFLELGVAVKRADGFRNKLKIFFGKPHTIDHRIRGSLERKLLHRRHGSLSKDLKRFILFQTITTLIILFFVLLFEAYLTNPQLIVAAFFILVSIVNAGALLEKQTWIFYLELTRLVLLMLFINNYVFNLYLLGICALALALTVFYHKSISRRYVDALYL